MKIKEAGFRELYHQLIMFAISDQDREVLKAFTGWETADCLLAYEYCDHMVGLTFEVLELGKKTSDGYEYYGGKDDVTVKYRFGAISDYDFCYVDKEQTIRSRHAHKIEVIHSTYAVEKKVEESRGLTILDEFRYKNCPDDVRVVFLKNGLKPEACWVTITDMEDERHFKGKLLNEPYADFGVHMDDIISFGLGKLRNGNRVLYFDSINRDTGNDIME